MKYKYKRFDNFLFRVDENSKINLSQDGKWIPYDEDDNYDVKMMGTPMSEADAEKWHSEPATQQPA